MYVSTKRLPARVTSAIRRLLWLSLGLAMVLSAQDVPGQDLPDQPAAPSSVNGTAYATNPGQAQQAAATQVQPSALGQAQTPDPSQVQQFSAGQYLQTGPGEYQQLGPSQNSQTPASPRVFRRSTNGGQSDIGDAVDDGVLFGDQYSGRTADAMGILGRVGVSTGPSIGRQQGIVPAELMGYGFQGNTVIFGIARGFRGMDQGFGGNFGGGVRFYLEGIDRIVGANVFYDYDNSSGALFRQVGFGGELLGEFWDARANGYFPDASTAHLLSTAFVSGSQQFIQHEMTYSNLLTYGNALRGADMEFGLPIPGRIPQRHALKVFGGAYYYSGSITSGFAGWKARAQANVMQNLNVQLEVMSDPVFHTNVVFGATYTFGGFRQPPEEKRSQFDRMTEMVRRQYNVAVARIPVLETGIVAINPLNNAPYFFEHVASYANPVGANGTVEHPWLTEQQAANDLVAQLPTQQQQEGNIIYVHANSVFNGATIDSTGADNVVKLIPGVRVLGEGTYTVNGQVVNAVHLINVPIVGNIPLPRVDNFPNRPIYENNIGNAVTLVSGISPLAPTEFSGFQIGAPNVTSSGPTGYGIFGNAVSNVAIGQDDVNFAQAGGIALNNTVGLVTMFGTQINNIGAPTPTSPAMDIENSVAGSQIIFGTDTVTGRISEINNVGGFALVVQNQFFGSSLNMNGSTINDGILATNSVPAETAGGVFLKNVDGSVNVGNLNLFNTVPVSVNTLSGLLIGSGNAIDVEGTTPKTLPLPNPPAPPSGLGNISFNGNIVITNPAADGILVNNMLSEQVQATPTSIVTLTSNVIFNLPAPSGNKQAPGIVITNANNTGAGAGAVVLTSNSGTVAFLEPVTVVSTVGDGILAQQNSGPVSFQYLQPSSTADEIIIEKATGNGIQIGGVTNLGGGNFSSQANTGVFKVTGITNITNVAGISILVGDPAYPALIGREVAGNTAVTPPFVLGQWYSNPLTPNTASAINGVFANNGQVTFNGNVTIDDRGAQGIGIYGVNQPVQFLSTTQVNNTTNSLASAVDIERNLVSRLAAGTTTRIAGDVSFNILNTNANQGPVGPPVTSGSGLNVVSNEANVSINQLNISSGGVVGTGVGLFAEDDGLVNRVQTNLGVGPVNPPTFAPLITGTTATPTSGLNITKGVIDSMGGAAVEIRDSVIGVNLTSISSTNSSTVGIDLENNIGVGSQVNVNGTGTTLHPVIFNVIGAAGALGTGGTIQGSANEGAYIINSETVQLSGMTITGNGNTNGGSGVYASTPQLNMINDTVTANAWYGINVFAVAVPPTAGNKNISSTLPGFLLRGSTVTGNLGTQEVLFTASTLGTYSVNMNGDTITHTAQILVPIVTNPPEQPAGIQLSSDAVMIQNVGAGIGSTISLSFVNNNFSVLEQVNNGVVTALPLSDLRINWNGTVTSGLIETNIFNFGVNSAEGLVINLTSTTAGANFQIGNNIFNSPAGIGTTGIDITTSGGPTTIQIGAVDGQIGNLFTFTGNVAAANGAVGRPDDEAIRLSNLAQNTNLQIFSNTINMTDTVNPFVGIEFVTVSSPVNAPTDVTINNNLMNLNGNNAGGIPGNATGIQILAVTNGNMRLFGTENNIINLNGFQQAIAPWFIAPNVGTIGTIIVNGVAVP